MPVVEGFVVHCFLLVIGCFAITGHLWAPRVAYYGRGLACRFAQIRLLAKGQGRVLVSV